MEFLAMSCWGVNWIMIMVKVIIIITTTINKRRTPNTIAITCSSNQSHHSRTRSEGLPELYSKRSKKVSHVLPIFVIVAYSYFKFDTTHWGKVKKWRKKRLVLFIYLLLLYLFIIYKKEKSIILCNIYNNHIALW